MRCLFGKDRPPVESKAFSEPTRSILAAIRKRPSTFRVKTIDTYKSTPKEKGNTFQRGYTVTDTVTGLSYSNINTYKYRTFQERIKVVRVDKTIIKPYKLTQKEYIAIYKALEGYREERYNYLTTLRDKRVRDRITKLYNQ